MAIEDRSSSIPGEDQLTRRYLQRETQFQLINLQAYKYINRHKRPTGNSFYELEGLIEAWGDGNDVGSFDFYQQNHGELKNSLTFVSEHTRGQQLRRIFQQLSSAVKPVNASTRYVDLSIVKKMHTSNIPRSGLEEVFTFMSAEYRDALTEGTIKGNKDAIDLLQLDSLPLLDHTREMVVNRAKKIEIQPDGTASYQLPTRVQGISLEYRHPQGKNIPNLLFAVDPLQ